MGLAKILVGSGLEVLLSLVQVRLNAQPISIDDPQSVVALALALTE